MKKVLAVLLILSMLCLTGCVRMVEITDEESETIARTAAWLLFKYDNNYTENLITPTPVPTATPTPGPEITPTPVVPDEVDSKPSSEVTLPEHNALPDEVIGVSGVQLEYGGYELCDSYTFDSFSVDPKLSGNCLMLVTLELKNTGSDEITVNLLELQPKICLYVDAKRQLSPKKTVLLNDFQYLVTKIPAGESCKGILVFEVEEGFAPDKLDLYMSVGEKTTQLKLQ